MPSTCLQWRALAVLGALLMVVSMWTMICAAKPLPFYAQNQSIDDQPMHINRKSYSEQNTEEFFHVLKTNSRDDNNYDSNNTNVMATINEHIQIRSVISSLKVPKRKRGIFLNSSNRVTVDRIKTMFYNNHANTSNAHLRNDGNKINEIKPNNNAVELHSDRTILYNYSDSASQSELNIDTSQTSVDVQQLQTELATTTNSLIQTRITSKNAALNSSDTHSTNDAIQIATTSNNYANVASYPFYSMQPMIINTTITTNSTTSINQSVFLDYINNYNNTNLSKYDDINDRINSTMQKNEIFSRTERSIHVNSNETTRKKSPRNDKTNLDRIERSANLSLTKATKRIQILIKSRLLQLLPDGTVNGTQNDESEFSK